MRWSVRSLALAQVALVLAGCAGAPAAASSPSTVALALPSPTPPPPTASPPPSLAPSPTAGAEPIPSIEPTHVAGVEPGLYAEVAASNLRIRSKPRVSDDSEKLAPLLQDGTRLLVIEGPVEASGYDWFHVQPSGYDKARRNYPSGWVAAGKGGEHWIEPFEFDCPPVPTDVDGMSKLNPIVAKLDLYYQISCYGGREITFTARLEQQATACTGDVSWVIEPAWFGDCDGGYHHGLVAMNSYHRGVGHVWAPDVDLSMAAEPGAPPENWPTVEVTGQFDHPAARTCKKVPNLEETPDYRLPALTILDCRTQFVVTSLREVEG